jgi:alpha-glucosidase
MRLAAVLALAAVHPLAAPAPAQGPAERIGDRMVRFWPDAAARARALPSLALAYERAELPGAAEEPPTRPSFPPAPGGVMARIEVPRGTSLYGTGEVAGPLLRNGRTVTLWNTDAYGWDDATPSLYQSHPWVLAVRPDGSSFGALADDPGRLVVDLSRGIEFRSLGPAFPVIVVERQSPDSVVMALADLTGRMPLPPRWALGWHQCRYSYAPDSEVVRVAREFRARRIPCDVMWMDIDYQDGNRTFTFHPRGFPDPDALDAWLESGGFRSVWIVDPGIKVERGYPVYDQGLAGDHWVKDAAGADWTGKVWPGTCVWPDFTREATRRWWGGLYADLVGAGADGIWNDMNEPAVFDVDSKTMPETNVHRADETLGGSGLHRRFHNVYGTLLARATFEGLRTLRPERRPFVLARAGFLGGQRWAATWTGDNRGTWSHLRWSVSMTLNLGLSGQPFAGPDIGGFAGPTEPELFARWIGVGALLPFARGHAEKGTVRKEPWAFGPAVEATARRAIETRYRLMPYLYTAFREASESGLPVVRPVFFADPADPRLRREDHAFLLGGDLLVVAQLDEDRGHAHALPRGAWRAVLVAPPRDDGGIDPDLPRLRVREGAIVPLGPVMQHVDERPLEEVTLVVNLDAVGRARGTLYEDDGEGYGYERGEYRLTSFEAAVEDGVLRLRERHEGAWTPPPGRRYAIEVLRDERLPAHRFSRVVGL